MLFRALADMFEVQERRIDARGDTRGISKTRSEKYTAG